MNFNLKEQYFFWLTKFSFSSILKINYSKKELIASPLIMQVFSEAYLSFGILGIYLNFHYYQILVLFRFLQDSSEYRNIK